MKWRRSAGLVNGPVSVPGHWARPAAQAPGIRASAGRASKRNVTSAETGLPGSPNKNFLPARPKTNGLPGLIETFQKFSSPPNCSNAAFTKSNSPTETPPVVIAASHRASALSNAERVASIEIGRASCREGVRSAADEGSDERKQV